MEVLVGYRVYRENGDKVDSINGKNYFGWSQKFDEWLSIHSPRVQPLNSMAKTQEARIYQMQNSEEIIDDSNDMLLSRFDGQDQIYVVSRSMVNQQKCLFLLYLGDMFAREGGVESMLVQIKDKNSPLELKTMVLQILSNLSTMFYRPYAEKVVQEVKTAVEEYIFQNTEANIRQLNKEKLESMFTAQGEMLKRVMPVGVKNALIEEYQLQISLLCFKSEILEKQLQGLKQICEVLRNARQTVQVNNNHKKLNTLK